MKPAAFAYFAPRSLPEVLDLLAEHGADAKLLAGGQSLVPLMNLRLAEPAVLIDLNRVAGLDEIGEEGGWLRIGAMARHREVAVSPVVRARCPLLAHAVTLVGFPAIRNRGTIGGSLSHADPVSEIPCVALTLGAELVVAGPEGPRTIPASDFFVTYLTTSLTPNEVLTEVRLPASRPGAGWGFEELSRKTGDFAIVAAAAEVRLADGRLEGVRIGLAGVADRPLRASDAESVLTGAEPSPALLEDAARVAADSVSPPSDVMGSSEYRRQLVRTLTRRAVAGALARARDEEVPAA